MFITFEGPDGSGKDTQLSLLSKKLAEQSDIVFTRDPSDKEAGEIRELLSKKKYSNTARILLYAAARAELYHNQIIPALRTGKTVISNRYDLSSFAYQGQYIPWENISMIHSLAGVIVRPDLYLVFISELPLWSWKEEDVMDGFCREHRKSIIEKYYELAESHPDRIKVIQVDSKTPEQVFSTVWDILGPYFEKEGLNSCKVLTTTN